MILEFHKDFKKGFKKFPKNIRLKFDDRLKLFIKDKHAQSLNLHKLNGTEKDVYSINITGDIRAQLYFKSSDIIVFLKIGTHNQLYG